MRLMLILSIAAATGFLFFSIAPVADKDAWSKPVNGIQARLSLVQKEIVNGTPILVTYLELQNVSDSAYVIEVPWDRVALTWSVTDDAGKAVSPADGPWDEIRLESTGLLRIPHDSTLKMNVAHRGAGIPKDQAAHLDLGPLTHWYFKSDDKRTLYLQGKLTVAKKEDKLWFGSLEMPRIKIPIARD